MMLPAIVLVVPVVLGDTNNPNNARENKARCHPFIVRRGGWPHGGPLPASDRMRMQCPDGSGGPYRTGGTTGTGSAIPMGGGAS